LLFLLLLLLLLPFLLLPLRRLFRKLRLCLGRIEAPLVFGLLLLPMLM
jgi:hypothetical protein